MKRFFFLRALCLLCGAIFFLPACGTPTPSVESQLVNVYATSAAQPWLADLYMCAGNLSVTLKIDANEPDIYLRLGEPSHVVLPTYQIDEEELVVIMNYARPPIINRQQITELFTGKTTNLNQITPEWSKAHMEQSGEVHVWAFSANEDIQQIFEQSVLAGEPIVSSARIAANPQEMLSAIANDRSAIGFLPRHWLGEGIFEQDVVLTAPVLAILKEEPQGTIAGLVSCLQAKRR